MIIRNVKFTDSPETSLRKPYEEGLTDLATNLAICMAEVRKWQAFQHAAEQALQEGMSMLKIAEIRTEDYSFKITNEGVDVSYEREVFH
tara:strand:- start:44 stop:310 length:267 start_codon:yes stop_codon:yes gene_type:complete